ncbi:MAG: ATP-binding cassette domain-containing protein [Actinobacteria bacterium]|nr:ATP-binding cassette domain-containing protein [Actinomycetota bacterium]
MSLAAQLRVKRGDLSLELELSVDPGRTLALVGPNGAGKSTALGAIAGLVPNEGTVRVGDRVLDELPVEQRRVGCVFQDYLLFPHLTVLENVAFGPRATGMPRSAARQAASDWLARLDLAALAQRRPAQLSGGQAQRVALARALATDPEVLLLDEPLAALDVEIRADVRAELATHLADYAGLTIVVTHSLADVTALALDVIVLERGRATQRGSLAELTAAPATPYVERLTRPAPVG